MKSGSSIMLSANINSEKQLSAYFSQIRSQREKTRAIKITTGYIFII